MQSSSVNPQTLKMALSEEIPLKFIGVKYIFRAGQSAENFAKDQNTLIEQSVCYSNRTGNPTPPMEQ